MSIGTEQVERIARLARLSLTPEEKDSMGEHLAKIIGYIKVLDNLDTTNVAPTSHVLDISNVMRKDQPAESLSPDEALSNAPDRKGQFYRVPKIIE